MKNQKIILISVAAGMVVILLLALLSTLMTKKQLDLYNIDQVDSRLSGQEVGELEGYLWQSLQRTQGFDEDKQEIIALIRPSSFVREESDGVTSYSFLMDVDEFKATYSVSFALMKGKGFYEAPMVDCPAPELMKYADTYCKGEKTSTMSVTIGRSLPYYFNLESGELVTVTRGVDDAGEEYLQARVSACGNETIVAKTTEAVQKWIKSLGYEPSDYKIKVPEFCDGAGN